MNMFTVVIWMIDKKNFEGELTPDNFKDFVIELEKENLRNLTREEKKTMVARIIREYEEAKKNDNP